MSGRFAVLVLAMAAAFGIWRTTGSTALAPGDVDRGRALFGRDCAVCHGSRGEGTFRGPAITTVGIASVDFQLRTRRMPLSPQDSRRPAPRYSDQEIDDVLAFVSTIVTGGPPIPSVDLGTASVSNGQRLFQLNCAACHQSVGSGGVLGNGVNVPSLTGSTAVEVVEAMRTGPGKMPLFGPESFTDDEAGDAAAYVEYLHHPNDRGGLDLGHYGPVPEGLVAVAVGLFGAVVAARLLGTRTASESGAHGGEH